MNTRTHPFSRNVYGLVVALALGLVASGCASSDPASDVGGGSTDSGALLRDISISSPERGEMDILRFEGIDLDADLSDLALAATADESRIDMFLFADDEGLFTLLPVHPVTPGQGGPVTLEMTAGGDTRAFKVDLEPLPKAPGALDAFVQTMATELNNRADQLGTTLADIQNSPFAELDADGGTLKMIAALVDDGSDLDLESALDTLDLTPEAIALADSVVAKTNMTRLIRTTDDAPTVEALGLDTFIVGQRAIATPGAPTAIRSDVQVAQSQGCHKKIIPIDSPEELAAAVEFGLAARDSLEDGVLNSHTDHAVTTITTGGGIVVGVGVGTGVLAAPAAVVAGGLGAANAAYATAKLWQMVDAASYPTRFVTMDVSVDRTTMNEDFTEKGHLGTAVVTAASTGFNAAEGFAGIGAAMAETILSAGVGKAIGEVGAIEIGMTTATGFLREGALGKAIEAGEAFFEICAQQWDVDLPLDEKYLEIFPVGAIEVDLTEGTYQPTDLGEAKIRFETTTFFPEVFAIADATITTERLEVLASPLEIEVEQAGDTVAITAELQSADTLTAFWEKGAGEWLGNQSEVTDSRETTRQLKTPLSKDAYPFTVRITSLSDTGLRAGATDERSTTVRIKIRDLIVEKNPTALQPGQTASFTATDSTGKPRAVNWSATGGLIDASGFYTAGKKPGTYKATATAKDDPNVYASATIIISGNCPVGNWRLRSPEFFGQMSSFGEAEVTHRSGEYLLSILEDGTFVGTRDNWSFEAATDNGSIVGIIDGIETGTWASTPDTLVFSESASSTDVQLLLNGNPLSSGSFADPGSMEGTVPFTCDPQVMTVIPSGGMTAILDRLDG